MTPYLLTGYRPERVQRATAIAEQADPADRLYEGPNLTMPDVRRIANTARLVPVAKATQARAVVLDMDGASPEAQNALLRLIEDSPPSTQFVLTAREPAAVLDTVASRCTREHFTPPGYADRLRDLTQRSGMSMAVASHTASRMDRGYAVEDTPDASAYNRARSLLEAARIGDVELAVTVIEGFDIRSESALREVLAESTDFETAALTFEAVTPEGAAWAVFHRRAQWARR